MSQNEQLVSIDRGAFWDLPYLRQLHLKWNPMLMSINSQAFVGTQNLQSIDVEGCQSLELGSKQMLDNITMAATSRLLRYEQSRLQNHTTVSTSGDAKHSNNQSSSNNATSIIDNWQQYIASTGGGSPNASSGILPPLTSSLSTTTQIKRILERPTGSTSQLVKYSYCLAIVCLIVVALKLLFKFTSTSHYLEARRRRRRVYESKNSHHQQSVELDIDDDGIQSMSSSSDSNSNSNSYQMCEQPDNHVIAAIVSGVGGGARRSLQVAPQSPTSGINNDQDRDYDALQVNGGQVLLQQEQQQQQQQEVEVAADGAEGSLGCIEDGMMNNDISVISDSAYCLGWPITSNNNGNSNNNYTNEEEEAATNSGSINLCCNEPASGQIETVPLPVISASTLNQADDSHEVSIQQQQDEQQQQPQRSTSTIDLIHSQLIAAGFDYGHANCAHFYQSLGPALQLADMTANCFVALIHL